MQKQQIIFKASGKVLIAGGYGILQQGNLGLSLAVDRHFYSITIVEEDKKELVNIEVSSPQIKSKWIYSYNSNDKYLNYLGQQPNLFVENALKYALDYSFSQTKRMIGKIKITIVFDRGFLSQTSQQKKCKEKFINYEGNPSKTGLGSSACVIVVVVGGILKALLEKWTYQQVNVLSHVANIGAQNKIGSNFDISTAIFGSQLYSNVLPRKAAEAVNDGSINELLKVNPYVQKLKVSDLIVKNSSSWLIDLRKGSNTRTMVGGFIKKLHSMQQNLIDEFYDGNKMHVQQLKEIMCKNCLLEEMKASLKSFNIKYRKFVQKYTQLSQIPIEPRQFNKFLDELIQVPEIVYCLCPGSGGYDAIFVLALIPQCEKVEIIQQKMREICKKYQQNSEIQRIFIEWEHKQSFEQYNNEIYSYLSE